MSRVWFTLQGRAFAILLGTLAVAAGLMLTAPATQACGFHSPQHLARGMLNWIYPEALHVRTAVWMAEDAGVLPPRKSQEARDMFAYQKTVMYLKKLGARLPVSSGARGEPVGFSAVLLDSVLWARFVPGTNGYTVQVHASGPRDEDVVVVTHQKVIKAFVQGDLDADTAERRKLVRLYRNEDAHDNLRHLLGAATGDRQPAKHAIH